METGQVSPAGVPLKLEGGRFRSTRTDRLRHARKAGEREQRMEEQQRLRQLIKKRTLSREQRVAGAHFVV